MTVGILPIGHPNSVWAICENCDNYKVCSNPKEGTQFRPNLECYNQTGDKTDYSKE